MSNLFDVLEALPNAVYSGDQIKWKRDDVVSDYSLANYSVEYRFRKPIGDVTATAAAVEEDGTYVFTVPVNMDAGEWGWTLHVTQTSDSREITIDRGRLTVRPQPTSADGISHAEIMLDAVEAEIKARVSGDGSASSSYSINGRSLQRVEMETLESMRKRYISELNAERRRDKGKSVFGRRLTRFS